MPRLRPRVITQSDIAIKTRDSVGRSPAPPLEDGSITKIVKYIPAEIMTLQQLLNGGAAMAGQGTNGNFLMGALSVGLLALTPIWYAVSTREAGETVAWSQVVLSTVAFAIWLLAVDSPAVGLLQTFGLPTAGIDKNLWSVLFAFFVGLTPMLEKISTQFTGPNPSA